MRIVALTEVELPLLRKCVKSCVEEQGEERMAGVLDIGAYEEFWRVAFTRGAGIFVVLNDNNDVVGGLGGTVYNDVHTDKKHALVVFWYMSPAIRGFHGGLYSARLWRKFEAWAREQGAVCINSAYRERTMPPRVQGFYERSGFKPLETIYRKLL